MPIERNVPYTIKWEIIMTIKKILSPLTMSALTLTLSMILVSNANAGLVTGVTEDTKIIAENIFLSAESNLEAYDYPTENEGDYDRGFEGEASAFISLDGEQGLYAFASAGEFETRTSYTIGDSGLDEVQEDVSFSSFGTWSYGELYSPFDGGQLQFSVNNCDSGESGEDAFSNCLNRLDAETMIDADWFNGVLGYSSTVGILYDQFNETSTDEDGVVDEFSESYGNWSDIDDTGFVAFAYNLDSADTQFGFLEITRGSISINQAVIQNLTTSVPEPASLLLLSAGLFGLASRKKLKA